MKTPKPAGGSKTGQTGKPQTAAAPKSGGGKAKPAGKK